MKIVNIVGARPNFMKIAPLMAAYGAYPAHTIGDFGFMPWPETIHAMASTKRAFAATWNSNGPGVTAGLHELVTRLRLHQSLPAFANCSLDANPGDGDHADSEKTGGINIYQVWEPETIVDEPNRWEITLTLRGDCPFPDLTTDLTHYTTDPKVIEGERREQL